jgi:tripartite-type tricarboxylate transporter receptor subunit TctC
MHKASFLKKACLFAALSVATHVTLPAFANEAAYFEDKTVRLVVGYSPGGGYDIYARMIAPYLRKYLKASVVVENKPGAGGITALNGIYVAPPDGLQMMLVKGNGAMLAQLTGQAGVRYDMQKFAYLGGTGFSPDVLVVGAKSPMKTVRDIAARKDQMLWAATGPMDGLSDGAAIICEALAIKCKVIMGYRTTNDAALALARGESEAMLTNESSAYNYLKSESVYPVAVMSQKRSRFFADTPTIFETPNLTADQKFWFTLRSDIDVFGRVLVAPPGMSQERVAFLQKATKAALTDPDLIAEGEKSLRYIEYQDAEAIQKLQAHIFVKVDKTLRERINGLMKKVE